MSDADTPPDAGNPAIIGQTMCEVCGFLDKAAATDATVLLVGETGTGKEVCARYLHRKSARAGEAFVVVPCAALSQSLIESELFGHEKGSFTGAINRRDGYFATANKGTLFLDDVDDLPLEIQGKLLHVLQSRSFQRVGGSSPERVDVRIVAATKRDLREEVARRRFRDDLMFRLNVVNVAIPPLRARRDDILELAGYFLKRACQRYKRSEGRLNDTARELLRSYRWPGNVRELEHVMDSAVIMNSDGEFTPADFSRLLRAQQKEELFTLHTGARENIELDQAMEDFERALLTWAFEKADRNQVRAAKLLGVPRSTFQYRWSVLTERNNVAPDAFSGE